MGEAAGGVDGRIYPLDNNLPARLNGHLTFRKEGDPICLL